MLTLFNDVLADIVEKSKRNNLAYEITGVLFYHNQRFVQVIEGARTALEGLMEILENDGRHQSIERVIDHDIYERGFAQWNMDSFNLSETELIDPAELKIISDVFIERVWLDSDLLVLFYKQMLLSHDLAPKVKN